MNQKDYEAISKIVTTTVTKDIPKFHRRGFWKALDTFSQFKRIISSNYGMIRYYGHRDISRLIFVAVTYAIAVNYSFKCFYNSLEQSQLDINNLELNPAIIFKLYCEEHNLILDSMIMQGILQILDYGIKPNDKNSLDEAYAISFNLLSKSSEFALYWPIIYQNILNSELNTRAVEILLNYKTLVYYSPKSKTPIGVNKYVHEFYNSASRENEAYRPAVKAGKDEIYEIFNKLSIPTELLKQNENISADGSSIDQIKEKYKGCYIEIEKTFKDTCTKMGLNLDPNEEKNYIDLIYIIYINSLHRVIGNSLNQFELKNTSLATITTPVYYRFKDHSTDILYNHIKFLYKVFNTLNIYMETLSDISFQQSILYTLGAQIRVAAKNNQFKNFMTRTGRKNTRDTLLDTLKIIMIKFITLPNVEPTMLASVTYINKSVKDFEKYSQAITGYEESIRIQYYSLSVVNYILSATLMSIPVYLCFYREDFGKYAFLYTTHEAWIAYSIAQTICISAIIYGLFFSWVYLLYTPRIDLIGYVSVYENIIRLFRPVMLAYIKDNIKNAFTNLSIYTMSCCTALYFLDQITFLRSRDMYCGNINNVYMFAIQFLELLNTYGKSAKHIHLIDKLKSITNIILNTYLNGYGHLNESYIIKTINFSNIECNSILNCFKTPYLLRNIRIFLPFSLWIFFTFIYLYVKTWDWYLTPEEINVR